MSKGPGKYDAECTRMLLELDADVVVLIVCGGSKGGGFSVSARGTEIRKWRDVGPGILRSVADQMERDLAPSGSELQ